MDVEHEGGYRTGGEYTAGDRKLAIVSGKDFSANQVYRCSGYDNQRPRSPEHRPQPPFFPPRYSRGGHSSRGGSGGAWCFSDPEMKRRRRVASYKAYSVEGKMKASFRKGFRWIKTKCSQLVHGW